MFQTAVKGLTPARQATDSKESNANTHKESKRVVAEGSVNQRALLVVALSARSRSLESRSGQWRIAGQNLSNSWSQPAEHSISPANVNGLAPKWVFTTGGDVSATPTVDGGAVYFPDWGGNLFAGEKDSGRLISGLTRSPNTMASRELALVLVLPWIETR